MATIADPAIGPAQPSEDMGVRDWLALISAMLGTFMAILDIQITQASLGQIQGSLGASIDEGSWISTAYLMAEVIVIPLTGWLGSIFGLRRYLSINTGLFVLCSIGCALSTSLNELILFRAAQGFTGGVLIPSAMTVTRTRLPLAKQAAGMALFGVTVTFAPAIGPTVGGWLTENLSWHYIFYLNVIPGIVAIALQLYAFDKTPMRLKELWQGDWLGIGCMAAGLSALTVVLEEGQRKEWFGSHLIVDLSIVAVLGIVSFLIIEFTSPRPFINLRLLGQGSIGMASLFGIVMGSAFFGTMFVLPVYLAQVQALNALQIGKVMMWTGLPQIVVFPMIPFLMRTFDARLMLVAGAALFAASCFINTTLTHDTGSAQLILPQVLRAIGQPLFMVPLSMISTSGLGPRDTADASAMFNVLRNVGGSMGIATLSTLIQSRQQFHFEVLRARITQNGSFVQSRMDAMTGALHSALPDAAKARTMGMAEIARSMRMESLIMSYNDAFYVLGMILLLSIAGVFLLKKPLPRGVLKT